MEKTNLIENKSDLILWIESGNKPEKDWRIGTEHEKIPFYKKDMSPVSYHGSEGNNGIEAILKDLEKNHDWERVVEKSPQGDNTIALKGLGKNDGASVSLEPGGQFELSGAPLLSIHETKQELLQHKHEVTQVTQGLDIDFLACGFTPDWKLEQIPLMPKQRYDIMRNYMPKVGTLGLNMMYRSATIQSNLDFSCESDMIKKLRVSLLLQPLATALFANSPFYEGKPSSYLSYRAHIWHDTDNNRCGEIDFSFDEDMSFERYVDYALDVPMYFILRDGKYIDASGKSFRDFIDGKLEINGEKWENPTLNDWDNHLSTIFPQVRLKKFLEMRGADGGSIEHICALSAFWAGILYGNLDATWELLKNIPQQTRHYMHMNVPKYALDTKLGTTGYQGMSILNDLGKQVLGLSKQGLLNRNIVLDGRNEEHFLDPLFAIVENKQTMAEADLLSFKNQWGNDVTNMYNHHLF
jgi:glutamate--cysteine ligase